MDREARLQGLTTLDREEMAAVLGGDDSGSSPTGFAYDVGRLLGSVAGGLWWALTNPPQASYSYAKVGY